MNAEYLKNVVARPLINRVPFSFLKRIGSCELVIVYYHVVNDKDEDDPHISNLYKYKRSRQFVDDLEYLLNHYSPVGLSDVIRWVRGEGGLPRDCFLLTVDDGFREVYDVMAPLLTERGIPATFFISSAFLDNHELCYDHKASLLVNKVRRGISPGMDRAVRDILEAVGLPSSSLSQGVLSVDYGHREVLDRIAELLQVDFQRYLKDERPYLTGVQVKELIDRGFAIGAHGIDHPYFSAISPTEQLEQAVGSMKKIRDQFGLDYGAFAFPHTDAGVSREFIEKIHKSGLVDITFGTGGLIDTSLRRHRQRVSLEDPLQTARELLAWQYARRLYKQWSRKGAGVQVQSSGRAGG
jgi:peptidoglycan/xylan/chitin deacetylase (PgdA/CDA1 family)